MESFPDPHRGSQIGSAVLSGLVVALVVVMLLKITLRLPLGASMIVACLAFILSAAVVLRQSRR